MDGYINEGMDGWTHGRIHGWIHRWMDEDWLNKWASG